MALTRANAEFLIVAELSGLLTAADMAVTVAGSNANLNGPIGKALLRMGHTVTDLTSVTDADVAQVADADHAEFVNRMELFTLETILGWLDDVDIKVGPRSESLSQLAKQAERKAERLREWIDSRHNIEAGYITRTFAEHD